MTSSILLFPGEESTPVVVQDALRMRHDRRRAAMLADIKKRTDGGAPLDDGDGPLVDPGEFSSRPDLEGVVVRFRVMSAKELRILRARVTTRLQGLLDARTIGAEAVAEATNQLFDARRTFLQLSIVEIGGLEGISAPLTEKHADALERSSLIMPLYEVAADFQEMPEGKVSRSG